jgi:antitoxin CptB
MSGSLDLSKLRWRCRRGTKELDTLTTRYLEHFFATAPSEEQQEFAALLEWQDPLLNRLLMREDPAENNLQASIVQKIHSL